MSEHSTRPDGAAAPAQNHAGAGARPRPDGTAAEEANTSGHEGRLGATGPAPAAETATPERSASAARPRTEARTAGQNPETPNPRARGQAEGVAQAGSEGPGSRPEEPVGAPSAGPKKPILAGAAIAGAVMVTLPFLLIGSNEGSRDKTNPVAAVSETADTVLDTDGGGPESGAFVAASPTPTPTPVKTTQAPPTKKPTPKVTPTPPRTQRPPATPKPAYKRPAAPAPTKSKAPQQTPWAGCKVGEFCLYGGPNGTGPVFALTPLHVPEMCDGFTKNLGTVGIPREWLGRSGYGKQANWDNATTSVWNRTEHTWTLFNDPNYSVAAAAPQSKWRGQVTSMNGISSLRPSWC
ncbi:peptidase inhibitor family I36 protein [Streptomyces sp. NPDC050848]|uniref:peptidase inhibitor family I36 protein n=1 Tax=Streptomyces sp. NPDC050848 TaxID=3155791 RepID=UPI0033D104B2